MTPPVCMALFARYPRPGRVKTRLQECLGPESACRLHEAMLTASLHRFASLTVARKILFLADCTEDEGGTLLRRLEAEGAFELGIQRGSDLGARMLTAAQEAAGRGESILFLGSDSPTVPLAYVRRALSVIGDTPVVIGPALDGGYYLLAASAPRMDLFTGMDWGGTVLAGTLARLRRGEVLLLPRWHDVDEWSDLMLLRKELDRKGGLTEYRDLLECIGSLGAPHPGASSAP